MSKFTSIEYAIDPADERLVSIVYLPVLQALRVGFNRQVKMIHIGA